MPYYSSVHRGTGFKSLLSTHLFEQCREKVLQFVSANSSEHCCIFTRNTTESINKLARRFPFTRDRFIVLTTTMEHHADDLPWRGIYYFTDFGFIMTLIHTAYAPKTVHVDVLADGQLDFNDFKSKLEEFKGQIALVAVTGKKHCFLNLKTHN